MFTKKITGGVVHELPADLKRVLSADKSLFEIWEDLTPLARNEWICWVVTVKRQETRDDHIKRMKTELLAGKRRPCCWMGCIHRTDKALSPSIRGILSKQSKSK